MIDQLKLPVYHLGHQRIVSADDREVCTMTSGHGPQFSREWCEYLVKAANSYDGNIKDLRDYSEVLAQHNELLEALRKAAKYVDAVMRMTEGEVYGSAVNDLETINKVLKDYETLQRTSDEK